MGRFFICINTINLELNEVYMIWTEWDKLTEVIVGSTYDANSFNEYDDTEFVDGLSKILEETEEDFKSLSKIFESAGVKVHRPKQVQLSSEKTRHWESKFPYPAICPRDHHIVYGDKILKTYGGDCNRYTEGDYFVDIMLEKFQQGRNFISMPSPILQSEYQHYETMEPQIMYHAANVLKCGDTVLHSKPYPDPDGRSFDARGTQAGLQWVKKNMPDDTKFIEVNESGHLDGTLALIKPGLLMTWHKKNIPEELKDWDYIILEPWDLPEWFHEMRIQHFYKEKVSDWLGHWIGYVDETVFDLNVISIDENTIISNGYDKRIADKLKEHNVEMIPFDFRHKYFWDSGLHCVTLDLSREGSRDRYV